MPREGCRRYNEDGKNKGGFIRFQEVSGGKCQWGNMLKEICVALVMFHPSIEIERRWDLSYKDEIRWKRVEEKHGLNEDCNLGRTIKGMTWLVGKVMVKGIEMNEGTSMVLFSG